MTTPNFNERDNNTAIEYDGDTNEICEGCSVNLEHDGTMITVRVVECTNGQPWVGEITDSQIENLKIGTTIQFEDCHVFRCAA